MARFNFGTFSEKAMKSIALSDARLNIWEGAVRSGKTITSLIRWLEFIKTHPDSNLIMIGKTARTLKRNVIDVLLSICGDIATFNISKGELYIDGTVVYTADANDERSHEKIRGITLAGAYGDEITLWPQSLFNTLLSRLSVEGAKFFGTTNPDSPYHWLKRDFIDRARSLDMRVFHFLLEDNPNISEQYINALKREYSGLWYKRFIEGLWVQAEGAVFDSWNEEVHVTDSVPECEEYYVGIDYGTANPTAFILAGKSKGVWYVVDEYYWDSAERGKQKTDYDYAQDLISFIGDIQVEKIFVDPSAASFRAECAKRGILLEDADNAVVPGIRKMASLLNGGELLVAERCKNLRREFASYVWDTKAQLRGEDKPLKQNDHALDALRYIINSVGEGAPGLARLW